MYEITKRVPVPLIRRNDEIARRKYPFNEMEVGDMFFVPYKTKNTLYTHVSNVGKQLGWKFTTRMTQMVASERGQWKPAAAGTPGAVRGVGVWRTK